nr:hypothetical protein Iba_chr14aCG20840 [Ipomoea batatas]
MIHLGIYICSLRKSAFYSWPGFCVGLSCGVPDCLLKLAGLEWEIEASLKEFRLGGRAVGYHFGSHLADTVLILINYCVST